MDLNTTFDKLENNTNNYSIKKREVINCLISAQNDWRFEVKTVKEFLITIIDFLGTQITFDSVNDKINALLSDINRYAWEIESLNSLLPILDTKRDKNLTQILQTL